MPAITTSFITANYVARALNYRGPKDWMPNQDVTIKAATPDYFLGMVQDIVCAGFDAVDVWTAHCHWRHHDRGDYLEQVKGLCSQFDLTITSYAGGFDASSARDVDAPLRFMKQLGAPLLAGGIGGGLPPSQLVPMVNDAAARYGVRWAFENHPEKTVEEIFERIDCGSGGGGKHDRCGVALDTGWCGTHGMDALDAVRRLHDAGKLFILHLKDVAAAGAHDTCAAGEGVVPCEQVVRYLAGAGWKGNISIEHEPFDRDPMPEVVRSVERVKEWLKG